MSIPTLLRFLGLDVPRYVTIDGRVIKGLAPAGVVATQMRPHRFHGGGAGSAALEVAAGWWAQDPNLKTRDVEDMGLRFPGFTPIDEHDAGYGWRGRIDTGRGVFDVEVLHRPDRSLPLVCVRGRHLGRSVRGLWCRAPHLYDSGALCVATKDDWDPTSGLTSTAVAWTAHWLAAYSEWRISGLWPTPGLVARDA